MILEPATVLCNPIEFATTASAGTVAANTDIAGLGSWHTISSASHALHRVYATHIPFPMRPRSVLGHSPEYKES